MSYILFAVMSPKAHAQQPTSKKPKSGKKDSADGKQPTSTKRKTSTGQTTKPGTPVHHSIFPEDVKIALDSPDFPQECNLCDDGQIFSYFSELKRHIRNVHIKRQIYFEKSRILFCKCKEGKSRGTDTSKRNGHYHCHRCGRPMQDRTSLRRHYLAKHGYTYNDLPDELK